MRKLSLRNPLNSNMEIACLREGADGRHLFMSFGVHSSWQSSGKPHKQSSASAPGARVATFAARVERNSKVFSNLKCQRTLRCAELSHHLERCVDFHVWAGVKLLSIVTRLLRKTFGKTNLLGGLHWLRGVKFQRGRVPMNAEGSALWLQRDSVRLASKGPRS
jgi:hypothetical protein